MRDLHVRESIPTKQKKGQYKDVQKNQRKPNFAHVEKLKIYTSVLDFILLSQLIQD